MRAQRRLMSACASAQSGQSLHRPPLMASHGLKTDSGGFKALSGRQRRIISAFPNAHLSESSLGAHELLVY